MFANMQYPVATSNTARSTPRPILKNPSSASACGPGAYPSSPSPRTRGAHFPPSPRLSQVTSTHSSTHYDRSPIVVSPNVCALPARGCPGRTYIPRDREHGHDLRRVLRGEYSLDDEGDSDEEDEDDGEATPTRTRPPRFPNPYTPPPAIPSLIADLSSESDESDGFSSPPPELNSFSGQGRQYQYQAYSSSPHDEMERKEKKKRSNKSCDMEYKNFSLCRAFSSCRVENEDTGCLGGF